MKDRNGFLKILKKHMPNVTGACEEYGINRKTYHEWCNKYPDFKVEVDNMREELLDISENVLFNAIKSGDVKSAQFALKYLAKKRGYTDSLDVNVSGSIDIITKWGDEIKDKPEEDSDESDESEDKY
jgi:hypothetical protein